MHTLSLWKSLSLYWNYLAPIQNSVFDKAISHIKLIVYISKAKVQKTTDVPNLLWPRSLRVVPAIQMWEAFG